jgi:ABC-2 type transport system permease protein
MWAIAQKEFRQLVRDRRTLAMIVMLPLILLIVFGYAANFRITSVPTIVTGPQAAAVAKNLPALFDVVLIEPTDTPTDAQNALRDNKATAAIVTKSLFFKPTVMVDGTQIFAAQSVIAVAAKAGYTTDVLFNPELKTSYMMIPGLVGLVLVFIGTLATSLGVVRERQSGTFEQLAVMPFSPYDVFLGKVAPYFLVSLVDALIVVLAGIGIFGLPFVGSPLTLTLGVLIFLFTTLGLGVLISTVSQNQGQAMQLSLFSVLPQVLLSGLIFPISAMGIGVRWIAYILPLSYFIPISRGTMIKGTPISALWFQFLMLAILGFIVFGLSVRRFRRDLAPSTKGRK